MTRVILLLCILYPMYTAGQFVSPCPNLFSYDNIGNDSWSGTFRIPIETKLSGIWLRAVFDRPFDGLSSDFGESILQEPNEYYIRNRSHRVDAGTTLTIRITAGNSPVLGAPQLLGFRLNAKTQCPENGVIPDPPSIESLSALVNTQQVELPMPELPPSPCPSMFQYEPRGPEKDRWHGNINLRADTELSGVWIKIMFDKPVTELVTDFGEVTRRGDGEFLVKNPRHKVQDGGTVSLRISPQFNPNEEAPRLIEIRLNARTVCPENGIPETTTVSIAQQLISPCPEIFTYEPPRAETDIWYGTINLTTDTQLNGLWLRVILDRQSLQLGIRNRDFKLTPSNIVPLRFFVKYNPGEPIPKLKEIKINAKTICPSPGGGVPPQNQVTPPSIERMTTVAPRPSGGEGPRSKRDDASKSPSITETSPEFQCGEVITKPMPLLLSGTPTEEGECPWHAALYYTGDGTPEYYCAGVLVSLNQVLTAAHCVTVTGTTSPRSTNDVQVYLGKYLLSKNPKSEQFMQVRKILIHPEYDNNNYANDIAVLHLTRPAEYTDWVRPVCLWSESISLDSVVEREGTVVGWGYDSKGQMTDKLLKAGMPVVGKACISSNENLYNRIVNDGSKNFCAGFRNGTSVCIGDSGGGLVFPMAASNSRWQLRGLVSLSAALQGVFVCDSSHYVVFTDVAQFLPWIEQAFKSG